MTTIIIARHGNTFNPGDTLTRVGARTDLPLVESGIEQAKKIGEYLKNNNMIPESVYTSHLQRSIETARIAISETEFSNHPFALDIFNEIDYGPDENKTENEVIARIGQDAIDAWNNDATPPPGWIVNPQEIINNWQGFANQALAHDDSFDHSETTLVVTSNGIARFAPHITGDFDGFKQNHNIKLSTGALGILKFENSHWSVLDWNVKP